MYNITGSQCQRAEEEERPWAIDQCPGSRGEESVRLQYSPLRWPTHCPHHTIIITYWHQPAQGANNTHYIIISLQNTRGLLSKQVQPLTIGYQSVLFGLVHMLIVIHSKALRRLQVNNPNPNSMKPRWWYLYSSPDTLWWLLCPGERRSGWRIMTVRLLPLPRPVSHKLWARGGIRGPVFRKRESILLYYICIYFGFKLNWETHQQ